jgi:hypothetical protein
MAIQKRQSAARVRVSGMEALILANLASAWAAAFATFEGGSRPLGAFDCMPSAVKRDHSRFPSTASAASEPSCSDGISAEADDGARDGNGSLPLPHGGASRRERRCRRWRRRRAGTKEDAGRRQVHGAHGAAGAAGVQAAGATNVDWGRGDDSTMACFLPHAGRRGGSGRRLRNRWGEEGLMASFWEEKSWLQRWLLLSLRGCKGSVQTQTTREGRNGGVGRHNRVAQTDERKRSRVGAERLCGQKKATRERKISTPGERFICTPGAPPGVCCTRSTRHNIVLNLIPPTKLPEWPWFAF